MIHNDETNELTGAKNIEPQSMPVSVDTYAFRTRDIRGSTDGSSILSTSTEYVMEKDGDRKRFDRNRLDH